MQCHAEYDRWLPLTEPLDAPDRRFSAEHSLAFTDSSTQYLKLL